MIFWIVNTSYTLVLPSSALGVFNDSVAYTGDIGFVLSFMHIFEVIAMRRTAAEILQIIDFQYRGRPPLRHLGF